MSLPRTTRESILSLVYHVAETQMCGMVQAQARALVSRSCSLIRTQPRGSLCSLTCFLPQPKMGAECRIRPMRFDSNDNVRGIRHIDARLHPSCKKFDAMRKPVRLLHV